jgi:putative membrane protein (TIGR04086 family)
MAMIKYFSSNNTNDKNNISFRNVIFSVLTSYLVLILGIFLLAVLTVYSSLSFQTANTIINIIYYFSFFLCGVISSINKKNRGWFNGLISTIVYFVLILVTVFSISKHEIELDIIIKLIPALIIGCVGGIFGVNKKSKKRKR